MTIPRVYTGKQQQQQYQQQQHMEEIQEKLQVSPAFPTPPNPLSKLFADKIEGAFELGHTALQNVLFKKSLGIMTLFAAARALEAVPPVPVFVTQRLHGRVISAASYVAGMMPGTNVLKFLGLFILVKAALDPLLITIVRYKSDTRLCRKVICGLLAFMVTKRFGWNIGVLGGVATAALGYPAFQVLSKKYDISEDLGKLTRQKRFKELFNQRQQ